MADDNENATKKAILTSRFAGEEGSNAVVTYLKQQTRLERQNTKATNKVADAEFLAQHNKTPPSNTEEIQISNAIKSSKISNLQGKLTNQNDTLIQRNPFVLTCQKWIDEGKYIYCKVNPSNIQWKIALRAKDQKTRGGTVQHLWKNVNDVKRGTFYDEPVLTITFQLGNILPIDDGQNKSFDGNPNGTPEHTDPIVPGGMSNFYNFMSLMNEERQYLSHSGSGDINGPSPQVVRDNVMYIQYNSRIFPNMTLEGMWTQDGFSFEDSAENPNEISSWSASFIVYDSFPKLTTPEQLIRTYTAAGFGKL